jgi:lipid-A-disaccharide synthase-like uncharacterized protein
VSTHAVWLSIGLTGQALFTARFLLQWISSEKNGISVVPHGFWWLSILGGSALLAYAISRRDPVIAVGQCAGVLIYARNLILISRAANRKRQAHAQSPLTVDPVAMTVAET